MNAPPASSPAPPRASSPLELAGFEPGPTAGSDRAFGVVFVVVFSVIGFFPLLGGGSPRAWALATAGVLLATAVARPRWLSPLNRAWFRLGLILHRIASPVIVAVIYFAAATPTGFLLRLARKDVLKLKRDGRVDSYWIVRDPPGPAAESLARPW